MNSHKITRFFSTWLKIQNSFIVRGFIITQSDISFVTDVQGNLQWKIAIRGDPITKDAVCVFALPEGNYLVFQAKCDQNAPPGFENYLVIDPNSNNPDTRYFLYASATDFTIFYPSVIANYNPNTREYEITFGGSGAVIEQLMIPFCELRIAYDNNLNPIAQISYDIRANFDVGDIYEVTATGNLKSFSGKDFDTFKNAFISYIKQKFPEEWTDLTESTTGIMLVEAISYMLANLSFYIDLAYNELFVDSAILPESIIKIAQQFGYSPKRSKGAFGIVKIKPEVDLYKEVNNNQLPLRYVTLPRFAKFFVNGLPFTMVAEYNPQAQLPDFSNSFPFANEVTFNAIINNQNQVVDVEEKIILIYQGEIKELLNVRIDEEWGEFTLPDEKPGWVWVIKGGNLWKESPYFISGDYFVVRGNKILFGNGIVGNIPGTFNLYYDVNNGSQGNFTRRAMVDVSTAGATAVYGNGLITGVPGFQVVEFYGSFGGKDEEGIEEIRQNLRNHFFSYAEKIIITEEDLRAELRKYPILFSFERKPDPWLQNIVYIYLLEKRGTEIVLPDPALKQYIKSEIQKKIPVTVIIEVQDASIVSVEMRIKFRTRMGVNPFVQKDLLQVKIVNFFAQKDIGEPFHISEFLDTIYDENYEYIRIVELKTIVGNQVNTIVSNEVINSQFIAVDKKEYLKLETLNIEIELQ